VLDSLLNDSRIGRLIELALMEDIGMGDITSEATTDEEQVIAGRFVCKQDGVIAGLDVAALVFEYCDHEITVTPAIKEGGTVQTGSLLGSVDGNARAILRGERTALNFLQRMSGIATRTREYVDAVRGFRARITDTRKTVPGLRVLDKWAVRLGGGLNHRFGLDDMVLIKDNHIAAAGGVRNALHRCREYLLKHEMGLRIEVETKTLTEVKEALDVGGVDRIMLDNFPLESMRQAVELIGGVVDVEASGGITLANVREVAATGVDLISVGALTHSVHALDISLDFPAVV
jgi:nicotinate-nucleotide pyrophosphorylase (carboxylating)